MFTHKWLYQGKVIKIIDGQTLIIWVDLGFDIWKKVMVRFNRIKAKGIYTAQNTPDYTSVIKFLEQNLNSKQVLAQIFKQKDFNGFDRFFAEIYTKPDGIQLKLKDINQTIGAKDRVDGLINFNDALVSQGFATHIQFNKDGGQNVNNAVQHGSPREHTQIQRRNGNRVEIQNQINPSGSGPVAEGQQHT